MGNLAPALDIDVNASTDTSRNKTSGNIGNESFSKRFYAFFFVFAGARSLCYCFEGRADDVDSDTQVRLLVTKLFERAQRFVDSDGVFLEVIVPL